MNEPRLQYGINSETKDMIMTCSVTFSILTLLIVIIFNVRSCTEKSNAYETELLKQKNEIMQECMKIHNTLECNILELGRKIRQ